MVPVRSPEVGYTVEVAALAVALLLPTQVDCTAAAAVDIELAAVAVALALPTQADYMIAAAAVVAVGPGHVQQSAAQPEQTLEQTRVPHLRAARSRRQAARVARRLDRASRNRRLVRAGRLVPLGSKSQRPGLLIPQVGLLSCPWHRDGNLVQGPVAVAALMDRQ